MTYAVLAYILAGIIWLGYFLSLRARGARLEHRESVTRR